MEHVHLCLTDLIDQDLTAYEYFHSLSSEIQTALLGSDIATFDELQATANRLKEPSLAE